MHREAPDGYGVRFRGSRASLRLAVRFAKESWCSLPGRFDNLENPLHRTLFAYLLISDSQLRLPRLRKMFFFALERGKIDEKLFSAWG